MEDLLMATPLSEPGRRGANSTSGATVRDGAKHAGVPLRRVRADRSVV